MEILELKKTNEIIKKLNPKIKDKATIIYKSENRIELSIAFKKEGLDSWKFYDDLMKDINAVDISNRIPHAYLLDGITIVAFLGSVKES